MSEDGKEIDLGPGKLYIWNPATQEWEFLETCSYFKLTPADPAKQLAIDSVDRASKN